MTEETTPEVKIEDLPQDIQPHVQTIRALAVAHNLIAEADFPLFKIGAVQASVSFLRGIRDQTIKIASEIEGADLVPELKEYKASQAPAPAPEAPAHV